MKNALIAVGLVAILGVGIVYVGAGSKPVFADETARKVDKLFLEWSRPDSPGCSVGISRNGAVVYERGFGMASLELRVPITPTSVFPVASVSKQFTAMSVMLLAQQGRLALDDEVRKYFTEFPDYGTPLTIRHVLTHSSGLRDAFALDGWSAPRQDGVDVNAALLPILARQRGLNFPPGSQFQYNNGGYNLLGSLVRRVSGSSLATFAETNIFKPLGMTQTRVLDDAGLLIPNRVSNYWRDAHGFHPGSEVPGVVGNTGVYSTVGDLLRWERNFVETRVGTPALVAAMQTPATLTGGGTTGYGYGLGIGDHRGQRVFDHGGGDRGIATYLARYPAHNLAIAVLCNSDSIPAGPLNQQIAEVALPEAFGPPPPAPATTATPPVVSLSAAQLTPYAGWYRHPTSGLLRVSSHDGSLFLNDVEGDNVDLPLTPIGSNEFLLLIADGSAPPARLAFVLNDAGQGEMRFAPPPGKKEGQAFERVRSTLSLAELQAFAGEYRSQELDTTYTVIAREGRLTLRNPGKPDSVVEVIGNDIFAGNIVGIVRFSRDAGGRVTGFTISRRLAQGIRFDRS